MGEKIGPRITLTARCSECVFCRSESYRVQGDSGHDVYCDHPDLARESRSVGDTSWDTPDWCPAIDLPALRDTLSTHQEQSTVEADAARYRWLRDVSVPPHQFYISVPDEFSAVRFKAADVDAYIDSALAALNQEQSNG